MIHILSWLGEWLLDASIGVADRLAVHLVIAPCLELRDKSIYTDADLLVRARDAKEAVALIRTLGKLGTVGTIVISELGYLDVADVRRVRRAGRNQRRFGVTCRCDDHSTSTGSGVGSSPFLS